jgi:hypothetical protein
MHVQQAWDHPVNLEHLRLELDMRRIEKTAYEITM